MTSSHASELASAHASAHAPAQAGQRSFLVTGASEGIGRVLCTELAKKGIRVTAVARNEERLQGLQKELSPSTGELPHDYVAADLSAPADVMRVSAVLRTRRFHGLINNAGVGIYGDFRDNSLESQLAMMHLNMDALVSLSHAFLQQAERGDVLMNVSSVLGFFPYPGLAAYAATKAFVTSLSASLWQQNRERGVSVLALHPGSTKSLFAARSGRPQGFSQPESMVQTAEDVVRVAMAAIARPTAPVVVSGWHNKVLVTLARLLPVSLAVRLADSK